MMQKIIAFLLSIQMCFFCVPVLPLSYADEFSAGQTQSTPTKTLEDAAKETPPPPQPPVPPDSLTPPPAISPPTPKGLTQVTNASENQVKDDAPITPNLYQVRSAPENISAVFLAVQAGQPINSFDYVSSSSGQHNHLGTMLQGLEIVFRYNGANYTVFADNSGEWIYDYSSNQWTSKAEVMSAFATRLLDRTSITSQSYQTMVQWDYNVSGGITRLALPYTENFINGYTPEQREVQQTALQAALTQAFNLDPTDFFDKVSLVQHIIISPYSSPGQGHFYPSSGSIIVNANNPLTNEFLIPLIFHEAAHLRDYGNIYPRPLPFNFAYSEANAYLESALWNLRLGRINEYSFMKFVADRIPDNNYNNDIAMAFTSTPSLIANATAPYQVALWGLAQNDIGEPLYISSAPGSMEGHQGYNFIFEYSGTNRSIFVSSTGDWAKFGAQTYEGIGAIMISIQALQQQLMTKGDTIMGLMNQTFTALFGQINISGSVFTNAILTINGVTVAPPSDPDTLLSFTTILKILWDGKQLLAGAYDNIVLLTAAEIQRAIEMGLEGYLNETMSFNSSDLYSLSRAELLALQTQLTSQNQQMDAGIVWHTNAQTAHTLQIGVYSLKTVIALQSAFGGGYGISIQHDATTGLPYIRIVSNSTPSSGGFVSAEFSLNPDGSLNTIRSINYEGISSVDGQFLFAGMKLLPPATSSDQSGLVRLTQVQIYSVEPSGVLHIGWQGKFYKIYRVNSTVTYQDETPLLLAMQKYYGANNIPQNFRVEISNSYEVNVYISEIQNSVMTDVANITFMTYGGQYNVEWVRDMKTHTAAQFMYQAGYVLSDIWRTTCNDFGCRGGYWRGQIHNIAFDVGANSGTANVTSVLSPNWLTWTDPTLVHFTNIADLLKQATDMDVPVAALNTLSSIQRSIGSLTFNYSYVAGGFKAIVTNPNAIVGGLSRMEFVVKQEGTIDTATLQVIYKGAMANLTPNGQLLFSGIKLIQPTTTDANALIQMTQVTVKNIEVSGTIHFSLSGLSYKVYRDGGQVILEHEITMPDGTVLDIKEISKTEMLALIPTIVNVADQAAAIAAINALPAGAAFYRTNIIQNGVLQFTQYECAPAKRDFSKMPQAMYMPGNAMPNPGIVQTFVAGSASPFFESKMFFGQNNALLSVNSIENTQTNPPPVAALVKTFKLDGTAYADIYYDTQGNVTSVVYYQYDANNRLSQMISKTAAGITLWTQQYYYTGTNTTPDYSKRTYADSSVEYYNSLGDLFLARTSSGISRAAFNDMRWRYMFGDWDNNGVFDNEEVQDLDHDGIFGEPEDWPRNDYNDFLATGYTPQQLANQAKFLDAIISRAMQAGSANGALDEVLRILSNVKHIVFIDMPPELGGGGNPEEGVLLINNWDVEAWTNAIRDGKTVKAHLLVDGDVMTMMHEVEHAIYLTATCPDIWRTGSEEGRICGLNSEVDSHLLSARWDGYLGLPQFWINWSSFMADHIPDNGYDNPIANNLTDTSTMAPFLNGSEFVSAHIDATVDWIYVPSLPYPAFENKFGTSLTGYKVIFKKPDQTQVTLFVDESGQWIKYNGFWFERAASSDEINLRQLDSSGRLFISTQYHIPEITELGTPSGPPELLWTQQYFYTGANTTPDYSIRTYANDNVGFYDAAGNFICDIAALLNRSSITPADFDRLKVSNPPLQQIDYFPAAMTYSQFKDETISSQDKKALKQLLTLAIATNPARFKQIMQSAGRIVIKPYTPITLIPSWEFNSAAVVLDNALYLYYNSGDLSESGLKAALPLVMRELAHFYDAAQHISNPVYWPASAEEYENQEQVNWMKLLNFPNTSVDRDQWITNRISDNNYTGLAAQYITGTLHDTNPATGAVYTYSEAFSAIMAPYLSAESYIGQYYTININDLIYTSSIRTSLPRGADTVQGYNITLNRRGTATKYTVFVDLSGEWIYYNSQWTPNTQRIAERLLNRASISSTQYSDMASWDARVTGGFVRLPATYAAYLGSSATSQQIADLKAALTQAFNLDPVEFVNKMSWVQHIIISPYTGHGSGHFYPSSGAIILNANDYSVVPTQYMSEYLIELIFHEATHLRDFNGNVYPASRDFRVSEANAYAEIAYWQNLTTPIYHDFTWEQGYNGNKFTADHIPDNDYNNIVAQAATSNPELWNQATAPLVSAMNFLNSNVASVDWKYFSSPAATLNKSGTNISGYTFTFQKPDLSTINVFADLTGQWINYQGTWYQLQGTIFVPAVAMKSASQSAATAVTSKTYTATSQVADLQPKALSPLPLESAAKSSLNVATPTVLSSALLQSSPIRSSYLRKIKSKPALRSSVSPKFQTNAASALRAYQQESSLKASPLFGFEESMVFENILKELTQ
ncbi:MAG TPA: hypothetical protein PLO78_07395 [Candidatus Omnitrophota bacterium]|nr:hypothetical protein [Candidatus Omnitrophota bacterium]